MASGVAVVKTSTDLHFFFNDTATTEIYALSLHDALPIYIYPAQTLAYACPEPGCPIGYTSPIGYFVTQDGAEIERDSTLGVACPDHGLPMYLAEVKPQKRSFRLWRCPQFGCKASLTNEASLLAL